MIKWTQDEKEGNKGDDNDGDGEGDNDDDNDEDNDDITCFECFVLIIYTNNLIAIINQNALFHSLVFSQNKMCCSLWHAQPIMC